MIWYNYGSLTVDLPTQHPQISGGYHLQAKNAAKRSKAG
jgi:hypothetical protein